MRSVIFHTQPRQRPPAAGKPRQQSFCQVLHVVVFVFLLASASRAQQPPAPPSAGEAASSARSQDRPESRANSTRDLPSTAQGVDNLRVGGRTLEAIADATSFATVIEVKEQAAEFKTVAQVLAETAGLQVRRFGGLGDFATVSVRGASSGQMRIYFDDVPLTRARSETVNLANLPLEPLGKIEVYRGTTPLRLGASALGGVINLVTKDPGPDPELSFLAGGGSFGTRQANLTASGQAAEWGLLGSFNYLGSEGDFSFQDDNGTPANPNDDERVRRRNNAFNSGDVILKAVRSLSSYSHLTALNEFYINEQGVPGIGAVQSTTASLFDVRNLSYLRYEAAGRPGLPDEFDATLFFIYEQEHFKDRLGEIGLGNRDTKLDTFSAGTNAHAAQALGRYLFEGRADLGGEVLVPNNLLDTDAKDENQSRIFFNVAVGTSATLFEDDLLIDLQLRYELIHDQFGGFESPTEDTTDEGQTRTDHLFTPRIGARYTALSGLWLKANAGRYGRFPNFSELFGNRGSIVGAPSLSPEKGWNIDAGVETRTNFSSWLENFHAEAVFYWRSVDDLILLIQNSQRISVPRNIGRAKILGVELTTSFDVANLVGFTGNYTYQDARDESPAPSRRGKQLPGLPRNEAYLRIDLHRWNLKPFYELNFASGNFLDRANLLRIPSRIIHTLGLRYDTALLPFTLTFEARNITNNQIEDVAGFPLPGLSFFGTLAFQWRGISKGPT